jgi:hypothetical protein
VAAVQAAAYQVTDRRVEALRIRVPVDHEVGKALAGVEHRQARVEGGGLGAEELLEAGPKGLPMRLGRDDENRLAVPEGLGERVQRDFDQLAGGAVERDAMAVAVARA